MPEYIRALIVIYIVSIPALFLAERFSRSIVPRAEFMMWAGCWLTTMAVVLLTRNFMMFAAFLGLMSIYCHRQPHKPVYLYIVLLFAAPALNVVVGMGGFANKLIEFNPARLLALFFLAPAALSLFRGEVKTTVADKLVLVYSLLLILLTFRVGKTTEVLRMTLTCALDVLLPYFVFSRMLQGPADLRKALCAFVIATLPIAFISLAETAKAWRFFQTVVEGWDVIVLTPYLFRNGLLRAAATCVQPISLGFTCMVAIGCLLSVKKVQLSDRPTILAIGMLALSLFVTLSRGPWVGTVVLIAITLMFQRGLAVNIARASLAIAASAPFLFTTSFGQQMLSLLPFVGADRSTEDYRFDLINASMAVIERNPFFGTSENYLDEPEMRAMIQGEGIVDVVNTYIGLTLSFGLVTLAVFCAIFIVLIVGLAKLSLSSKNTNWNASALLGTLIAMAFTLGTVSSVYVIPYICWTFFGLCAGVIRYAAVGETSLRPSVQAEPQMRVLGQW